MDENNSAYTFDDDVEPLMPDGWQEGQDIFGNAADDEPEVEAGTEPTDAPESADSANPEPDTPTTAESEEQGETDTEEPSTTEADQQTVQETNRLRFKARFDHEDRDVEIDEAELPTLYQKAQATDRAQQRMREMQQTTDRAAQLARQMGYESADKLLEEAAENYRAAEIERLVDEGTAHDVAEFIVDQKMGRFNTTLPDSPDASIPSNMHVIDSTPAQAQAPVADAQSAPSGQRDYEGEVAELLRARPQLVGKPIPDEVINEATAGGKRLLDAYTDYESRGTRRETERLRKENSVLKQNAEAAARAPVKGTAGGGKTDTSASDPFLAGFNSDPW